MVSSSSATVRWCDSGADDQRLVVAVKVGLVDRARAIVTMPAGELGMKESLRGSNVREHLQNLDRVNFADFL